MRSGVIALSLVAVAPPGAAQPALEEPARPVPALKASEIARWPAEEARQGVAVDAAHFYAVTNSRIAKYDKATGERIALWTGDREMTRHINSCAVIDADLVCANSNFPLVPMASSVETFDAATLAPKSSHSLGHAFGSLTWIERHDGRWWAGFAHYDGKGGEPGFDHRFTQIVIFDDEWRRVGGYLLPDTVLEKFAPMSNSGGSFGPDGLLYLTGHDLGELYVLQVPEMGPTLRHVATIAVPLEGQAWAWDRSSARTIYGITRETGEVVSFAVPLVEPSSEPSERR